MKRYDSRFGFLLTTKQKKDIKRRASRLDISVAEYLRCLVKIDTRFDDIEKYNAKTKNKLREIEIIKAKMGDVK
ncbi:MAG: hypothetical protein PHR25_02075 [Clostridia bacterium]|nr:hypothetical protein [Clostridia bacterium]